MSNEQMTAMIAKLQAENASLRKAKAGKLTLKVSAKGAVSIYGLGKWPATQYAEQWERILDHGDELRKFIVDNRSKLATKGDKTEEKPDTTVAEEMDTTLDTLRDAQLADADKL